MYIFFIAIGMCKYVVNMSSLHIHPHANTCKLKHILAIRYIILEKNQIKFSVRKNQMEPSRAFQNNKNNKKKL